MSMDLPTDQDFAEVHNEVTYRRFLELFNVPPGQLATKKRMASRFVSELHAEAGQAGVLDFFSHLFRHLEQKKALKDFSLNERESLLLDKISEDTQYETPLAAYLEFNEQAKWRTEKEKDGYRSLGVTVAGLSVFGLSMAANFNESVRESNVGFYGTLSLAFVGVIAAFIGMGGQLVSATEIDEEKNRYDRAKTVLELCGSPNEGAARAETKKNILEGLCECLNLKPEIYQGRR